MARKYPPIGTPVRKLENRKCGHCESTEIYLYVAGMYTNVYFVECANCDLGTANVEENQSLAIKNWDDSYLVKVTNDDK